MFCAPFSGYFIIVHGTFFFAESVLIGIWAYLLLYHTGIDNENQLLIFIYVDLCLRYAANDSLDAP